VVIKKKRLRPASLVWTEALDKGDLKNKVDFRDHVLSINGTLIPEHQPRSQRTEQRFGGLQWGEKNGLVFVEISTQT